MKKITLYQSFIQQNISPYLYFVYCALLLVSGTALAQNNTAASPESLLTAALQQRSEQPPVLPATASPNWYREATALITEREYSFQPFGKDLYSAANHAQRLGFLLSPRGYTVKNFSDNKAGKDEWEYHFKIAGIGKQGHIAAMPRVKETVYNEKSLTFKYNNFNVEYNNGEKGMRQNFIVSSRPAGNGRLQVVIDLEGDLAASVVNNQLLLSSVKDEHAVQLAYDKLKVWDADNKPLIAGMQLRGDHKLVISVDDKNAVYPVTVDPLNHLPDWTASGQGLLFPLLNDLSLQVLYGYSVNTAGDVNGDGYADLIVGAPAYVKILSISGNSFNVAPLGAAFIYYGSASGPSATPNEVLQPSLVTGALAGFSVSSAGDVNGDGKSDVIVSAPGDNINLTVLGLSTSVSTGKVYLYSGSSFDGNINTQSAPAAGLSLKQPDFGLLAVLPVNPLFGFSISAAGDVNGDGFGDIIVGSPAYLDLLSLTLGGRVDIYHGSASGISTTPNGTIKGGLLNGLFGLSVSTAGKVNNDSYSDIIVGSPASLSLLSVGAAYVFHGSAAGITATMASGANTKLQAPGLLNGTLFGFSVANAGDVNGDGRDDVIIGEPLSLETLLSLQVVAVGKAHIFYGSNTGILTAGGTDLTSPRSPTLLGLLQGNLLYGFSVAGAGDMNCDGLADVVVGEPGGSAISLGTGLLGLVSANALSGSVYLYAGKTTTGPVNLPFLTIQETAAVSVANLLGASVHTAGDVNGDGHLDLIVGAPNGTLNLASSITGLIGNALNYLTINSVGSAYLWMGCSNSILLPVQLLSFNGKEQENDALLNWAVTGADKNTRFEIEKSTDGHAFTKIGAVTASATGGNNAAYSFTDAAMIAPNNYYRLKLIDTDGKITYSKVILIVQGVAVKNMRVSPNPAREMVQLRFSNIPAGNYTVMMFNISGQTAFTKNIMLSSVNEIKNIERTPAMMAGTYFIRLVNQNSQTVSTSKIILQ